MREFISKNFVSVICIVLVVILLIQSQSTKFTPGKPVITVVHDTVEYHHDSIIVEKPTVKTFIVPDTSEKVALGMIPDTNYAVLKAQYNELVEKFLTKNLYDQSYQVDTLGSIRVQDTVSRNFIAGRKLTYDLKTREINTTTTIREPYIPKRQLYYGGGIYGNQYQPIQGAELGIMYKNRKDNIIQFKVQSNFSLLPSFGIGYYKKF